MVPFIPRGTDSSTAPLERSTQPKLQRTPGPSVLFEVAISNALGKTTVGKRPSGPVTAPASAAQNLSPSTGTLSPAASVLATSLVQRPQQIANQPRSERENLPALVPAISAQADNSAASAELIPTASAVTAEDRSILTGSGQRSPTGSPAVEVSSDQKIRTEPTSSPALNSPTEPTQPTGAIPPLPAQRAGPPNRSELPVRGLKATRAGLAHPTQSSERLNRQSSAGFFSATPALTCASSSAPVESTKTERGHASRPTQLNSSRASRTRLPSVVDAAPESRASRRPLVQRSLPTLTPASPNQARPESINTPSAPIPSARVDPSPETQEIFQAVSALSFGTQLPSSTPARLSKDSPASGTASAQRPAVPGPSVQREVAPNLAKPAVEDSKQPSTPLTEPTPFSNQPESNARATGQIQSDSDHPGMLPVGSTPVNSTKPDLFSLNPDHTALVTAGDESAVPMTTLGDVGPALQPASATQVATTALPNSPNLTPQDADPNEPGKDFPSAVGTSAAQQEVAMKKGEKVPKNAESALQILPSEGALSAAVREPAASSIDRAKDLVVASQVVTPSDNTPADTRLQILEKTRELVTTHALRLTHSNNDGMRVIIEPGSGTRLSLELRFTNGGIEAQAQLHRGDFDFLSNHWADLQQRLQPQGVTLGALEISTGSSPDKRASQDTSSFTQRDSGGRDPLLEERDILEPRSKVKTRIRQYAGWESWA
jgi:hypothetical protein